MEPSPRFAQIEYITFTVKKVARIFVPTYTFLLFKKLPEVNNRPRGENSSHLVNLMTTQLQPSVAVGNIIQL
jgi:hypothetical protein